MLIGLGIRDVVLAASLDLAFGPGLTVLTGETGAGKSIILDALGLALGARGEAGLVRRGAAQAMASALFAPASDHPVWTLLDDRGLTFRHDEDLVLRRVLSADGRSRAFVNDQAVGIGVLKELGEALVEVHGQHETVGLLDARTHRPLLDAFGALGPQGAACALAWTAWREAEGRLTALAADQVRSAAERDELSAHLTELDRLAPREGEEAELAGARAMLSAAERAMGDIAAAGEAVDAEALAGRLGQAFRALGRARERALAAGVAAESSAPRLLEAAAEAVDRAAIEAAEAAAAIDAAAGAFTLEPGRLEESEQRLFALRAAARKLGLAVDDLPAARADLARRLAAMEGLEEDVAKARNAAATARAAYLAAAARLGADRRAAGERLTLAVQAELGPLHLGKARFRVGIEPLAEARFGPAGADRAEFEIATLAAAPFAPLGSIASGGELARLALALEASLAVGGTIQPVMIFDEVDQGVGGAVADAVGQRLARLAGAAQVLVVTHSPQVAARAAAHWRVSKIGSGADEHTAVEVLGEAAREEEIARMLSGERITEAARAAARALMAA
ncbi:MAG TPA: DNA repair protein RecN [Caulobacteraceae bacterium]|jgi:DNA repair protein RecN (Recombination protein N)|nr:DNA repair protein RecN [Caulobacteraceae bacterium]